jgi:predicted PurR-regulated permease PerM
LDGTTSFISRYWRVIFLIIIIAVVLWLIWDLLNVLLPFILGLILSFLVLPLIRWAEKKLPGKDRLKTTKRVLLVVLLYLVVITAIGLTLFYTIPLLVDSIGQFIASLPELTHNLSVTFQNLTGFVKNLPPEIQSPVNTYISNIGSTIGSAFQSALAVGFSYLSSTFGFILGFVSLPVFLFFLLKDAEKLSGGFYSAFSPWWKEHIKGTVDIFGLVLGRYIRASIVLGLVVAVLDFIGLQALGIPYAPALAFWAGVTELIPVIGPWIGAIPGVIVAMATHLDRTIWVIIVFFVVQQLEGNILVPRIHSQYLNLHPTIILVLLVVGGHFAGLWGIILIVPATALFVQLYKYILHTIREESLKTPIDIKDRNT